MWFYNASSILPVFTAISIQDTCVSMGYAKTNDLSYIHFYYWPHSVKQVILCGSFSPTVGILIFIVFSWVHFMAWKITKVYHKQKALLESHCCIWEAPPKRIPGGPPYNIICCLFISYFYLAIYLRSKPSRFPRYPAKVQTSTLNVSLPLRFDWRDKHVVTQVRNQQTVSLLS